MNSILIRLAFIFMRKNKIRTLSSSIGIALASVLMTVVVILASSISASMLAGANEKYGSWHFMSEEITQSQLDSLQTDGMVKDICYLKNFGYSPISNPVDSAKPYVHIADVSSNFTDFFVCNVLQGRMPQSGSEIAVSEGFVRDYPEISLGYVIAFELGKRISVSDSSTLWQNAGYLGSDNEFIQSDGVKISYTVVGIVDDVSSVEYKFSPGYTLLTCSVTNIAEYTKVYMKSGDFADLEKLTDYISEDKIIYNTNLLSYLGINDGENLQDILKTVVAVLIAIIGIAAFALINNSLMSFSDERSKQFGVLFSLGMTRIQTFLMYLTEVFATGILSVLIGMGIGTAFVFLTYEPIGTIIAKASYLTVTLTVSVDFPYLLMALGTLIAILGLSAFVAAVRQMKGTAIAKLKKNTEIKNPKRQNAILKSSKKSIELSIVYNNFKRYHKKYLYVIISMSLSAVLFIAAGLFGGYADNYISEIMPVADYDITVTSRGNNISDIIAEQYEFINDIDGINESGWLCSIDAGYILTDGIETDEFKAYADGKNITKVETTYIFISDGNYNALSGTQNSETDIYVYDNLAVYVNGERQTIKLFKEDYAECTLLYMNTEQRIAYYETDNLEENSTRIPITVCRTDKQNFPIELQSISESGGLFLIIPISRLYEFVDETPTNLQMYFSAADHSSVTRQIKTLGEENGWRLSVNDIAESYEKEKSTYALFEIFAVVFTILISVAAIINVFNAVYSNLIGRRREFAVMQSIGLSKKSFFKIILYECLFLCGIVTAITLAITPVISALLSVSFPVTEYTFVFPWKHIVIAVSCLFVVFIAAAIKPAIVIKRQNVIETIKGDSD